MSDRGKLTVYVDAHAYGKMMAYARAVTTEIGGLLDVEDLGKRGLYVKDAWLVEQEVTAGSVDFKVGEFEKHIKEKGWWGKRMPHLCMGIWHSHVDMGVFMSGTDENDLVRKYACRGWLVNIVVNKKGEMLVQVDSHVGPAEGKPEDYVLVTVPSEWSLWAGAVKDVKKEIAEKVKEPVRTWARGGEGEFGGGWQDRGGRWTWDPKKKDLVDVKGRTKTDVDKEARAGRRKALPATLDEWNEEFAKAWAAWGE